MEMETTKKLPTKTTLAYCLKCKADTQHHHLRTTKSGDESTPHQPGTERFECTVPGCHKATYARDAVQPGMIFRFDKVGQ
jgi:hypothetical protein